MNAADDRLHALSGSLLARLRRGIEKESLRVTRDGKLATTPHPAGLGWVADSGEGAIGYAIGWVAGDEAELADLAVARPERRRGIGAGLVRAFAGEAGVRGARQLYLEVRDSNAEARRFYDRLGFRIVGRRAGYYRTPREDALVLRARLPLSPADDPNLG